MKDYATDVTCFNRTGGINLSHIMAENVKMQCSLIAEEYAELAGAIFEHDPVKTLDGIVDLAYVLIGLGLMEQVDYSKDEKYREDILKKNIMSINVTITRGVDKVKYCSAFNYVSTFVDALLLQMEENIYSPLQTNKTMCAQAVCYLKMLAEEIEADFDAAWDEVQRSNMSKFCKSEDGSLYALHREDGKIQKGPDYFRPDLKQYLKSGAAVRTYRKENYLF